MDKLIAIGFSLCILGQAWLVRRYVGTWIFPACLFGGFWFLFTFIPLVALFTVPINPMAVFYILCMACTFSLTSLVFPWRRAFTRNFAADRKVNFNSPTLRRVFQVTAITAVVCIMINAVINGFVFTLSIAGLLQSAATFLSNKYEGSLIGTIFAQVGYVSMYTAGAMGGLIVKRKAKSIFFQRTFFLAFLPPVLLLVIEGNKGALPLVAAMFWGAMLVQKLKAGEKELFGPGSLKQGILLVSVALPLITFSFLARGLYEESNVDVLARQLARLFASYSSGHLYAFADWYTFATGGRASQMFVNEAQTGGFYTFMSLFRFLGDTRFVPEGVYDEYFQYGFFLQSNIYTVFRGMITDFGLFGAFVVNAAFGFLVHISFLNLLEKRVSAFHIGIFVHVVGIIYSSYIISLLIWNSVYASLFGVVLAIGLVQVFSPRMPSRPLRT